jgi:steroid delta-isomerase-like uncharacterized protein
MSAELNGSGITIVRKYIDELLNGRKLELAEEILTDDCIYLTPASTFYSREDIVTFKGVLFEAWSGFQVSVQDMREEKDMVLADVRFEATPVKSFLGIPPTYKKFSLPATGQFKIRGGKIQSIKINYDFTKMLNRDD